MKLTLTGHRIAMRRLMSSLGIMSLFLFYSGSAAALDITSAKVESIRGWLEKRPSSALDWERTSVGEILQAGTDLRTGDDSEADLVTGRGHRLHLDKRTTLTLKAMDGEETVARLESGKVLSKVKHLKTQEKFLVETPTAVCAVRGTEFLTGAVSGGTDVAVFKGIVGVAIPGGTAETAVHAGQMTSVRNGRIEMPHALPAAARQRQESALAHLARHEVGLDMTRAQVIAAAAMERRFADYQEGKSLIDVSGHRVRLEEYIVRPHPDEFKFVVLNERENDRLDYFFYDGIFNRTLPTDLSLALKQLPGTINTQPDYFLTSYEMGQSNTVDSIHDTAAGGHLVSIALDAQGNYTLTDAAAPSNTKVIPAAQLQTDGTYKIYNPLGDSYSTVTAAQKDAAIQFSVYIPENNLYRDLAPGDTVWRTRFNSYSHLLDNVSKQTYTASSASNILTTTTDANWTYAGGFVIPVVTPDPNNVDSIVTNYYGDGTFESYRTVLIDDQGSIAPLSAFSGISTGSEYKNELLKWNYEQQVSATEFQGRKIDLVVEPKIFIESGLIQ